jgi:hypothetical protein
MESIRKRTLHWGHNRAQGYRACRRFAADHRTLEVHRHPPSDRAEILLPLPEVTPIVSIDELQVDLDAWIRDYNEARPSRTASASCRSCVDSSKNSPNSLSETPAILMKRPTRSAITFCASGGSRRTFFRWPKVVSLTMNDLRKIGRAPSYRPCQLSRTACPVAARTRRRNVSAYPGTRSGRGRQNGAIHLLHEGLLPWWRGGDAHPSADCLARTLPIR